MMSILKKRFASADKGFKRKVEGSFPISLADCADNNSLIDMSIEGNCYQDGTPTVDTPIEIQSVGVQTESGEYEIPIIISGKNLFYPELCDGSIDNDMLVNGVSAYGDIIISGNNLTTMFKAGHTYTLSFDVECVAKCTVGTIKSLTHGLSVYNNTSKAHEIMGIQNVSIAEGEKKHVSVTGIISDTFAESDVRLVVYTSRYVDDNNTTSGKDIMKFTNIQIEESEYETDYQEFVTPTTKTISLSEPLRYTDILNVKKKEVTRNFGCMVLDSTWKSRITTYDWTSSSTGIRYCGFSILPKVAMVSGTRSKGFCSHAECTKGISDAVWFGVGSNKIFFLDETLLNLGIDGFCSWLDEQKANGTPLTFVYPLAEPITEEITPPNIPTVKGGTTYFVDTVAQPLSASAEYYSTTKGE